MDMDSSSSTASGATMGFLCSAGCGFFGTSANRGLCSKCYAAKLREETAKLSAAVIAREEQVVAVPSDRPESESSPIVRPESESGPIVRKNRCGSCNKKIGLVGFKCRCGVSFCGAHRYPEEHGCEIDYQETGRALIRKENPVCKADKIAYRI